MDTPQQGLTVMQARSAVIGAEPVRELARSSEQYHLPSLSTLPFTRPGDEAPPMSPESSGGRFCRWTPARATDSATEQQK